MERLKDAIILIVIVLHEILDAVGVVNCDTLRWL